ncbi:MAG: helix-turn-helix domain-containing protein [Oscillospiraceae bacterium]|jgi:transcriptional regulator with XRE-family HTH domain|nr:helix-turn-helix domain-containing protein [Oscillospiraceae bacterium]
MQEKTNFGAFICEKRKAHGLTQRDLAMRLYVTESAVSKWERGLSYPDITLVTALCGLLDITEHELLTSSDDLDGRRMVQQLNALKRRNKLYLRFFYILYMVLFASLTPVFLVQENIPAVFVTAASIAVGFSLTCIPVLIKENTGLWALGSFYLSLNMLMFFCAVLTGGLLNWFFIAFFAVLLGFSVFFLPFVLRGTSLPEPYLRHKALCYFVINTALLFALEVVTLLTIGKFDLFFKLAVPTTLIAACLPWALMLIIRYAKIHACFKAALCLIVFGIHQMALDFTLNWLYEGNAVFSLQAIDLSCWTDKHIDANVKAIILAALLFAALICTAAGIIKKKKAL